MPAACECLQKCDSLTAPKRTHYIHKRASDTRIERSYTLVRFNFRCSANKLYWPLIYFPSKCKKVSDGIICMKNEGNKSAGRKIFLSKARLLTLKPHLHLKNRKGFTSRLKCLGIFNKHIISKTYILLV